MKTALLGMTLAELEALCNAQGLPRFAAKQMADWLYKKKVRDIAEMTNLSKAAREKLSQTCEVAASAPAGCITSSDGTRKYTFPTADGRFTETVMIPDGDRATVCVSCQAGCKMGCRFCMTGRQGFHGNLTAAEILSQFICIDEADSLTNAVFMGMGEPLDNWENVSRAIEVLTADWGFAWSPKRITLSTIGITGTLKEFLDSTRCHLAVSLHNPFPDEREELMPAQHRHDIRDVIALIKKYDFSGQRRVSFEYTMFAGVNDDKRHADGVISLLKGIPCRVNLIRFHKIPDSDLATCPTAVMELFEQRLQKAGITTTIRASRGEDILAACGMLAGKVNGS
ncbi:MAG: 23S rRNA (adenine(2503)-C(2))-methyltransferase RlmN [Bacteroidales bacterium]|jgi:23S rRNA (adenine2503-C2)-methyltransferase|nr:23S rRNA (adenine(2503)-C(2))-methyltransferase RlmN [Bacteroidales bacterium]